MAAIKTGARWNSHDYDFLLATALQAHPDAPPDELLRIGQQSFPEEHRKGAAELTMLCRGGNAGKALRDAITRVRAMKPRQLQTVLNGTALTSVRAMSIAKVPAPHSQASHKRAPHRQDANSGVTVIGNGDHYKWPRYENGLVRWTDREAALMVRRFRHWQATDSRLASKPLGVLFSLAQEVELPPDRRRNANVIKQGDAPTTGWNKNMLARGESVIWTLDEKWPFDPERTRYVGPETADQSQPPAAQEAAPVAPPPPPDWAASRAAAQAVRAPLAPQPSPEGRSRLGGPMAPFVDAFARLLGDMLDVHERQVLERVDQRLDHIGRTLGATLAETLIREMKGGVASMVHGALEQELGGPVAPPPAPAAPAAAAPASPAGEAPPDDDDPALMERAARANDALMRGSVLGQTLPQQQEPQPKATKPEVDIIGLFPRQQEDVRRAINGHVDMRFYDPDHPQHWKMRCNHVVIAQKGAGGLAVDRVRKAGLRPVVVPGGSSGVIHAIEDMFDLPRSGTQQQAA